MQMVENYRRDVVVINESLSYGKWYRDQVLEKSVNFMIGANPHDYEEFSENMPLIGLVRNLGMDNKKADSLLIANLAKNYQYSELKARGQEANEQTITIYRYLARLALTKEPTEEQQTALFRLIGN